MKPIPALCGALLLTACAPAKLGDYKRYDDDQPFAEAVPPSPKDRVENLQYMEDANLIRLYTHGYPLPQTRRIYKLNPNANPTSEGASKKPNIMKMDIRSDGQEWRLTRRMPLEISTHTLYGGSLEGDGYSGDVNLIVAYPYLPRAFGDIFVDYDKPAEPGEERFRRGNIQVSYRFYESDKKLTCFTFVENGLAAGLKGDVCAPAGKRISKPQVEAIIKGIGADSFMPMEPSPDLARLPVD